MVEYGGDSADTVQVDLTLPPGATVAENPAGWTCTGTGENLRCESVDPMAPGEMRALTLSLEIDEEASAQQAEFATPTPVGTILGQPASGNTTFSIAGIVLVAAQALLLMLVFVRIRRRKQNNLAAS